MDFTTLPYELQNIIIDALDAKSASVYFVLNREARDAASASKTRHLVTRRGIVERGEKVTRFYLAGSVFMRIQRGEQVYSDTYRIYFPVGIDMKSGVRILNSKKSVIHTKFPVLQVHLIKVDESKDPGLFASARREIVLMDESLQKIDQGLFLEGDCFHLEEIFATGRFPKDIQITL